MPLCGPTHDACVLRLSHMFTILVQVTVPDPTHAAYLEQQCRCGGPHTVQATLA